MTDIVIFTKLFWKNWGHS